MRKQTSHGECVLTVLCTRLSLIDATIHAQSKVVHSDNLITGQNPASARPLGEELLKTLQAQA